jgi:hypothetical protein
LYLDYGSTSEICQGVPKNADNGNCIMNKALKDKLAILEAGLNINSRKNSVAHDYLVITSGVLVIGVLVYGCATLVFSVFGG